MGFEPERAHGSLRLTPGLGTSEDDVQRTIKGHGGRARADASRDGGARRGRIGLMGRTVAAMSGGVDSSVAAALLAREASAVGDEVIGVWMRLHPDGGEGYEQSRSCCSPDAADDARQVAQIAGIPFFILNLEREFGARVIDAFADGYLDGATPDTARRATSTSSSMSCCGEGWPPTEPMWWPPATMRRSRIATAGGCCSVPRMRTRTRPTSSGFWTRSSCAIPGSRWGS